MHDTELIIAIDNLRRAVSDLSMRITMLANLIARPTVFDSNRTAPLTLPPDDEGHTPPVTMRFKP